MLLGNLFNFSQICRPDLHFIEAEAKLLALERVCGDFGSAKEDGA